MQYKRNNKMWTNEEDFMLLYYYVVKGYKAPRIALLLERTSQAIHARLVFVKKKRMQGTEFPHKDGYERSVTQLMQWVYTHCDQHGIKAPKNFVPQGLTKIKNPVTEISKEVKENQNIDLSTIPSDAKVIIITSGSITVNNK